MIRSAIFFWQLVLVIGIFLPVFVCAQTTGFTYQGKLADGAIPAGGSYDFEFKLFDSASVGTGTQQGGTLQRFNVSVVGGIFTVQLDFGTCTSCFSGAARFLEISVKPTSGGVFTTLGPRQQITSSPYAVKSLNAVTADNLSLSCVSCVTSNQIQSVSGGAVTGAIPVASVPAGSASYIQNRTSPQSTSNFNITGDGTVGGTLNSNTVNATTQYNIGGERVLSTNLLSVVVGLDAGPTTTGSGNVFLGYSAGRSNTTGTNNTFVGSISGFANSMGGANTFVGRFAGEDNTTGFYNTFLGSNAGSSNTTGNHITIVGTGADVASESLSFATAIGAGTIVSNSNSIALGRADGSDTVRIPGAVIIDDTLIVNTLGGSGFTQLCLNLADRLATCSSSLRYKTNVKTFFGGLDVVRRLRPIRFTWKEGGMQDIGFGAEEVNQIEPLLTTRNKQGEIEGVKYGHLTTVLINAVKEQQAQFETQQAQFETQQTQIQNQQQRIEVLQKQIAGLTAALCQSNPQATVCKEK